MKNIFSAQRENLMSFEPTFIVLFNGVAVIERGCTAKRAHKLVQSLNRALRQAKKLPLSTADVL
jgi:predicted peroxiredoxin